MFRQSAVTRKASRPTNWFVDGRFASQYNHQRSNLRRYMQSFKDCKDVTTRHTRALMKDNGLRRVLVKACTGMKDPYCTLYVKGGPGVPRNRIELCEEDGITFCPELRDASSRAASQNMTTKYVQTWYKEVKKEVMWLRGCGSMWIEKSDEIAHSFVGFARLSSTRSRRLQKSIVSTVNCACLPYERFR